MVLTSYTAHKTEQKQTDRQTDRQMDRQTDSPEIMVFCVILRVASVADL